MNKTILIIGLILGILLSITLAIIITIFTISLISAKKVELSLEKAAINNIYCSKNKKACELNWNDKLIIPNTFTGKYDKDITRFCADQVARVEIVNDTPSRGIHAHPGTKIIKKIMYLPTKNRPLIGIISLDKGNNVWLSFRGTTSVNEWVKDFQMKEVGGFHSIKSAPKNVQMLFATEEGEQILCHQGFLNIYGVIQNQIFDSIKKLKPKNIIISGHSLGSALATLASVALGAAGYNVYVYVFASPRVCNEPLSIAIKKHTNAFFRVTNQADIIPSFPLSVTPNIENPNKPFFYDHVGVDNIFADNRKSLVQNHSLATYINSI